MGMDTAAMSKSLDSAMNALKNSMGDLDKLNEMSHGGLFGGLMAMGIGIIIVLLAIVVFMIACQWKVYSKAGKPGWACIVPIYNLIVLLEICGKPWWWFFLMLIPIVNIVIIIIVYIELAKSFGHGAGFALGLMFLGIIFWPILAFGSSKYVGPGGKAATA